jgi:hypothetical protein
VAPRSRTRLALLAVALAAGLGALVLALRAERREPPAARTPAPAPLAEVRPQAADGPRPLVLPPAVHLAPPAEGARLAAPARGAFEGRVVSMRTAVGLPRAQLTFARGGATTSVTAGPDGSFVFEPHEAGRWTLAAATAEGHLPFAPEWGQSPVLLEARPGEVVRGPVVALAPAEPFLGLVVDPAGAPVADAEVRLLGVRAGESALVPLAARFRSARDGTFRFTAPEDAVLEARKEGFATGRTRIDLAARVSRKVTIPLGPRGDATLAIAGVVEDRAGAPAEGALVSAVRKDRPFAAPASARADVEGRFGLDGLAPGTWILTATRAGSAPASTQAAAGTSDVRIRLAAGGALSGRVRDRRTGAPVAPFTVLVRGAETRGLSVVDPAGTWGLDDLSPGEALVQVVAPGYAPSPEVGVTVPDPGAPPATIDLDLAPGGTLTGIVVERGSGRPIAEARVEVEGAPPTLGVPVRSEAATDRDGRFTLAGLAATRVSILAFAAGHHGRILSAPPIPEGETRGPLTIELSPAAPGEDPRLELAGIGATVGKSADGVRIERVLAGGGAAEVGLGPGDEILAIDGAPARAMPLQEAVPLLRGPEGTAVRLLVVRSGDPSRTPIEVLVPRRLFRV